jgi:hypothetical protein
MKIETLALVIGLTTISLIFIGIFYDLYKQYKTAIELLKTSNQTIKAFKDEIVEGCFDLGYFKVSLKEDYKTFTYWKALKLTFLPIKGEENEE